MADDWRPTASLENLEQRGKLLWRMREYFHTAGMLEVQTPLLSQEMVLDRHIDPIPVPASALQLSDAGERWYFLQTSPEFGMKRLLAAGMRRIYQISSVFRAGERGDMHNPEFTMVEWYRVGDGLEEGVGFLADLVQCMLGCAPPQRETYATAFTRCTGLDPLECATQELCQLAVDNHLGVDANWSSHRDAWLDLIFSEMVQPQLGTTTPTIITHYPASQSALARVCPLDSRTAERFELFAEGVELANGYHELLDAPELVQRNAQVAKERLQAGKLDLPRADRLLQAMQAGLPACSGCALGLDRLMMLALGAQTIDAVIPFPIERA